MSMLSGILNITIGVVAISGVLITTVKTTNTTGWSSAELALWGLITIAAIAGIVVGIMQVFGMM